MNVFVTTASRASGLAVALLLGAAAPAGAQNLLGNASFDGSLSGWSNYGSAVPADGGRAHAAFPEDASGVAGSGSAQLNLAGIAPVGTQIGIAQCVAVAPNQAYNYGARFKQPTGQATTGVQALVDVVFFSDGACATPLNVGEEQGVVVGTAYPLSDTLWQAIPGTVPTSGSVVTSPAGAASAQFRLLIERTGNTSAAVVRYDQTFFGVNLTPVQLQTYTVD